MNYYIPRVSWQIHNYFPMKYKTLHLKIHPISSTSIKSILVLVKAKKYGLSYTTIFEIESEILHICKNMDLFLSFSASFIPIK